MDCTDTGGDLYVLPSTNKQQGTWGRPWTHAKREIWSIFLLQWRVLAGATSYSDPRGDKRSKAVYVQKGWIIDHLCAPLLFTLNTDCTTSIYPTSFLMIPCVSCGGQWCPRPRPDCRLFPVTIHNLDIKQVSLFKYLGVMICATQWGIPHIEYHFKKIEMHICFLRSLRCFLLFLEKLIFTASSCIAVRPRSVACLWNLKLNYVINCESVQGWLADLCNTLFKQLTTRACSDLLTESRVS